MKKPRLKEDKINGKVVIVKDFKKGKRKFKKDRYEKEKSVYKQLEKIEEVKTPKLIEAKDNEEKLVLEKLDNEEKKEKDDKELVDKLIEFQFSGVKPEETIKTKIQDDPGIGVIYFSTRHIRKIGFKTYLKILKELITYYLFYKGTKRKILLHNDLNKGNVFKDDNEIKLIDFEHSTRSRKWLFKDVVHHSFIPGPNNQNKDLVKEYIEKLKQEHPQEYKRINIKKEIKMAKIQILCSRKYDQKIIVLKNILYN